ncbi:MAG TPA: glycosyltransferase [Gaiellaceae bacterium]
MPTPQIGVPTPQIGSSDLVDAGDHAVATLAVSIVSHCNRALLIQSLAALDRALDDVDADVVVLDNASGDGSPEAVRAAFPNVRLVERGTRAGFGENHNRVARGTRSRFLLLLNDDTVVRPDAVRVLLAYLDAQPQVAAVGPRIVSRDGRVQETAWRLPSPLACAMFALGPGRRGWVQSWGTRPHPVGALSGCALLLRRDAFERVGLFDERFFMYAEDLDLCERLRRAGHEVHYVPGAEVVHDGQQSSAAFPERRLNEHWRSLHIYWGKHHRPLGARIAATATAMGLAENAAITELASRLPPRLRPARVTSWRNEGFGRSARLALRGPNGHGLRELAEEFNLRQHGPGGGAGP